MSDCLPSDAESRAGTRNWPHAPPHELDSAGVYFVTARTLHRDEHFRLPERLSFVRDTLLSMADKYGWQLEAWAVLSNHYHFVAHSPGPKTCAHSLKPFLKHLHADICRTINRLDDMAGRQIWCNYRETHLTFQRSYLARLNYTHGNAVHHGLVRVATDYPWCSAKAFESTCTPAWVRTIQSFQFTQIALDDEDT